MINSYQEQPATLTLTLARRIAGLSMKKLAALADVDISFISLLEAGKRDWRHTGYETLSRIAGAVNLQVAELFPQPVPTRRPRRQKRKAHDDHPVAGD